MSLDQLYEIVEAAVVRPGDTLVISFANNLSQADADFLAEKAKCKVGDDVRVLIVGGALGLHVLRRDEEPTDGRGDNTTIPANGATDKGGQLSAALAPADVPAADFPAAGMSVPPGGAT